MRSVRSGYVFTALVAFGAILMLPVCGHAQDSQDSTVGGTVMDPSGAVIPGVTMTATHTEFNSNLAYQPRMLQLGFRTTF